jgi:hypothetical protein
MRPQFSTFSFTYSTSYASLCYFLKEIAHLIRLLSPKLMTLCTFLIPGIGTGASNGAVNQTEEFKLWIFKYPKIIKPCNACGVSFRISNTDVLI